MLSCLVLPAPGQNAAALYEHGCKGKGHKKPAGRRASLPPHAARDHFLLGQEGICRRQTFYNELGLQTRCLPMEEEASSPSTSGAAAGVSQQGDAYFGSQQDSPTSYPREWPHSTRTSLSQRFLASCLSRVGACCCKGLVHMPVVAHINDFDDPADEHEVLQLGPSHPGKELCCPSKPHRTVLLFPLLRALQAFIDLWIFLFISFSSLHLSRLFPPCLDPS